MKSIDTSKKYAVTLTFLLDEAIMPQLFAEKIARECGGGVLRPGEMIRVFGTENALVVTDETLSLPSFGYQWRSSRKTRKVPKRKKLARNRGR